MRVAAHSAKMKSSHIRDENCRLQSLGHKTVGENVSLITDDQQEQLCCEYECQCAHRHQAPKFALLSHYFRKRFIV